MNKMIFKTALGSILSAVVGAILAGGVEVPAMMPGIYLGAGGSWNKIDLEQSAFIEMQNGTSTPNPRLSATENFTQALNFFAPQLDLGYWMPISEGAWLWGVQAQYKYLNFQSPRYASNLRTVTPQIFPQTIVRTKVSHELLMLGYFGYSFSRSYVYLGLGASMFDVTNLVIFNNQNTGSASNEVRQNIKFPVTKIMWGYAAQLGYNYYVTPTCFWSVNYTYAGTSTESFNNNFFFREIIAGGNTNDPVIANRTTKVHIQELIFSINKVFTW